MTNTQDAQPAGMPHGTRVSTRHFVGLLLLLALVLPLTGWLVVYVQGPTTEQEAFTTLSAIARLKTDQIENWLGERRKSAELLAGDGEFALQVRQVVEHPADSVGAQVALMQRFTLLRSSFDFDNIELLAPSGEKLSAVGEDWEALGHVNDLPAIALPGEQRMVVRVQAGEQGDAQLQWLVPIHDLSRSQPRLVAWVRLGSSLQRFLFPVIQTWPTASPSGEMLLVTIDGDRALYINELRHRSGTAMKLELPMARKDLPASVALRTMGAGQVMGYDHRNVLVLSTFRPVQGTDWRIVAKMDRAEVLAPVHTLAWWVVGVTGLAMLALAAVLALFWRQIRLNQAWQVWAEKARSDRIVEQFFTLPFIGIATVDLKRQTWGRLNPHFCAIVGLDAERMLQTPWSDLVDPQDAIQDRKGFARVALGRDEVYAVDRQIRRGDGTQAWVNLQLRRLPVVRGTEGGQCVVMLEDITARVKAERRFQRQARLYAALSACNQAIVQSTSESALFARVCETAVCLGGMQAAWIGRQAPDDQALVALAFEGAACDTLPGQGTARTALREDRAVWIEDLPGVAPTVAIALHCAGQVDAVFVLVAEPGLGFDEDARRLILEMATDVDFALGYLAHERHRKQAEKLLRQSQQQLELVLKGSTDAPWDWDLRASRLDFSVQGWHLLGYGTDDMPQGPIRARAHIHPQDLPVLRSYREQLQDANVSVVVQELRLRHQKGHYVPVLARGYVSRDKVGNPVRVTGTVMDQTLQQQTRQLDALRAMAMELIAAESDVLRILAPLVERLEALLPQARALVWLVDAQTGALLPRASCALAPVLTDARAVQPIETERGAWGAVAFSTDAQSAPEVQSTHLRTVVHSMARSKGLAECCCLPILSDSGALLGVLDVFQRRGSVEAEHEQKLLHRVVHYMASAIQRKAMEDQGRLAAEVFSHSHDAIMVTDAHQKIVLVNPAFSAITGYAADEVLGRNPRLLSSGRHGGDFYGAMWRRIAEHGLWQGEIWNQRKDGEVFPEWLTISRVDGAEGQATHYIAIFADVSQRKADEQRIRWMAHFDVLTGLPNRALLSDRFVHAMGMAQRSKEPMALMFLDLDHFKHINDSLGHGAGDELLVAVAQRMRDLVREQDTVARMGGDEFVLLLPGTDKDGAAHLARKILETVSATLQVRDHELRVTPSVGIAMYPEDGNDLETLLQHADVAMYRAKQEGRNAFHFFLPDMQAGAARALEMESALRRAMEGGQFQLHYQPQCSLRDGRVVGVEALIRWLHPEWGMVSPAEFIPLAEKRGHILAIGEWVLRTAVQQLAQWQRAGLPTITMAVNISAVQFRHPDLPGLVSQVLQEYAVDPACLELELTEGVASDDPERAVDIMENLHARGVRMSIDDFGTGYSSLSYLKRFQVYKLKIDRSFVRDITEDAEDKAIVSAIVRMASSLGLQTIAEGVETEAQRQFLQEQGCDEIQGYLFSRPLPAAECERLMRTHQGQVASALGAAITINT